MIYRSLVLAMLWARIARRAAFDKADSQELAEVVLQISVPAEAFECSIAPLGRIKGQSPAESPG
jgi:hypothetical protein